MWRLGKSWELEDRRRKKGNGRMSDDRCQMSVYRLWTVPMNYALWCVDRHYLCFSFKICYFQEPKTNSYEIPYRLLLNTCFIPYLGTVLTFGSTGSKGRCH